jgi:hypothetical protein
MTGGFFADDRELRRHQHLWEDLKREMVDLIAKTLQ